MLCVFVPAQCRCNDESVCAVACCNDTVSCMFVPAQCRSNDESVHAIATDAVRYLATQCSDSAAIESLAKHFFAVINGLLHFLSRRHRHHYYHICYCCHRRGRRLHYHHLCCHYHQGRRFFRGKFCQIPRHSLWNSLKFRGTIIPKYPTFRGQ